MHHGKGDSQIALFTSYVLTFLISIERIRTARYFKDMIVDVRSERYFFLVITSYDPLL